MGEIQAILTIGVPTIAVLLGILINNSRLSDMNSRLSDIRGTISDMRETISDLRAHMDQRFDAINQRFDDTKETLRADLRRVEEVLDARLKHLEEEAR